MKKKIKFKIEYVPLSDARIEQHKDFSKLMTAFVAAPKPNVFRRMLNNRYALVSSGVITGAVVSSLMVYQMNTATRTNIAEVKPIETTQTTKTITHNAQTTTPVIVHDTVYITSPQPTATQVATTAPAKKTEQTIAVSQPEKKAVTTAPAPQKAVVKEETAVAQQEVKPAETLQPTETIAVTKPGKEAKNEAEEAVETAKENITATEQNKQAPGKVTIDTSLIGTQDKAITYTYDNPGHIDSANAAAAKETVALETTQPTENASNEPQWGDSVKTKKKIIDPAKVNKLRDEVVTEVDSSARFIADKAKTLANNIKLKRDKDRNVSLPFMKRMLADSANTTFKDGYAQASFVPGFGTRSLLGAQGYMNYVSLNIISGYNGALKGFEVGGVANMEKGYVTGAQVGGVMNLAAGDVTGAQFAGVINLSRSLRGFQASGVTNLNQRTTTGMQAAGALNLSVDSLIGFQASGAVNMIVKNNTSFGWQVAGGVNYTNGTLNGLQIAGGVNVGLHQVNGGQISGGVNFATVNHGFQIGVVNIAGKMRGFQFGVVNVADSMHGGSIGLFNFSRNGQFSIDLWSGDALQMNGGFKLGNKSVYNIYAFGISPFGTTPAMKLGGAPLNMPENDLLFGFGLGLGGHIPIHKAFVNIDGMTWSLHNKYFDFNGINMLNQFRITGGFQFNKYLGIYAGPVLNVSIQDNNYNQLAAHEFYEYNGTNNTVRSWVGFAAGLQFF